MLHTLSGGEAPKAATTTSANVDLSRYYDQQTILKLIVETESDKVVGAHMFGPDSAEIIQGLAVALKAGATKQHFDTTIGVHPSAAEEFVTMREPHSRFINGERQ